MSQSNAESRRGPVLVSPTEGDDGAPPCLEAAEDNRLYSAWLAGDDTAFEGLVERHGASVRRFLEFYLGDGNAAEDAWSATFLKVVRARTSYTPGGNFKGWLITIARRSALDVRRSKTRWFRLLTHTRESSGDMHQETPSAERQLVSSEQAARVREALAALSEEHRSIVLLTYQQELSSIEIAEVLDLDPQQVRSRLTYARRLLKAELDSASTFG
jgi:RNA polymerase sigma-70 factor (ECF subfamily)